MIHLNNRSIIYIISSPAHFTGGTLLLHQLADWLQSNGFKVQMYYIPNIENPIHAEFKKYNLQVCDRIEDDKDHLLVIPEIFPFELLKYKKIKTAFWWLSVDNYFRSFKNASKKRQLYNKLMGYHGLYKKADFHFCQSQYAVDFLKKSRIKGLMLSDYLHDKFISEDVIFPDKQDTILYNPRKGQEFTQQLINAAPDLYWKPLINMTPGEVYDTLLESKIYIDFGFHPGKDRFPREAAICGCCIISGKRGAAANNVDLPIPQEYKFEENEINWIVGKIRFVLKNFDSCQAQLSDYRYKIRNEKSDFDQQANRIFIQKE